jgi:DNA-binding MarR family transcriptional regulator
VADDEKSLDAGAAIIRLSTAVGERVLEARAVSGLAPRQLQILRLAVPGVRMNSLAGTLGTPKSTMTSLVDQLETLGLVVRTSDKADRRAQLVSCTDTGRAALHSFDRALEIRIDELLEGLARRKAQRLRQLLSKVPDPSMPVPLAGPR